jgi:hypothetical protein
MGGVRVGRGIIRRRAVIIACCERDLERRAEIEGQGLAIK